MEILTVKKSELSGGQKQLLNLASVMVMQPKILILDEPTSQRNPTAASDFFAVLKNPYRGEVKANGRVGLLPQDPQTLFVKKTVLEDLNNAFASVQLTRESKEQKIGELVRLAGSSSV